MNGTLAWDISGKMDETDCIDIDPFTLYELNAINSLIISYLSVRLMYLKKVYTNIHLKINV